MYRFDLIVLLYVVCREGKFDDDYTNGRRRNELK